ncbi:hypothetical protein CP10139811_0513 [Chlamydia ibidis]|uniref:Uncharacterized protein n=2 Tax=Chlamydia ibidis TaxID=1405396 RepID=S7KJD1_9CHLA|nr:hypothetical protein CP10139811_0513 [Chlamydia ibidis]EQM62438.1 hypothetical protein H359_0892 [Chlamydia ibidis 10-1398/6]
MRSSADFKTLLKLSVGSHFIGLSKKILIANKKSLIFRKQNKEPSFNL